MKGIASPSLFHASSVARDAMTHLQIGRLCHPASNDEMLSVIEARRDPAFISGDRVSFVVSCALCSSGRDDILASRSSCHPAGNYEMLSVIEVRRDPAFLTGIASPSSPRARFVALDAMTS